jgi:hypothetical protein
MAIFTLFEVHGNSEEIVALQEKFLPAARIAEENGGISHTIVETDHGIMVVNVWETEDGMRNAAEKIGALARQAGVEEVGWRQYDVLHHGTPRPLSPN